MSALQSNERKKKAKIGPLFSQIRLSRRLRSTRKNRLVSFVLRAKSQLKIQLSICNFPRFFGPAFLVFFLCPSSSLMLTAFFLQNDLLVLSSGFGAVEQVLLLKSKNQALLQFTELNPAISFMQYYSTVQLNVR